MKISLLIPIVLIVIVAGGTFLWWTANRVADTTMNQESTSTTPTPQQQGSESVMQSSLSAQPQTETGKYTVRLTDEGFEPESMVVPVGTEVVFVNESAGEMWIASDPHPDHTDYAEFDQLESGDRYAFTFTESGAYTYHNHVNETDTGLILVE